MVKRKKIRVGFFLRDGIITWNGGLNYYTNLIKILLKIDEYIPVILCSYSSKVFLEKKIPEVEIRVCDFMKQGSVKDIFRKAFLYIFEYNLFVNRVIKQNDIDIVAHTQLFPLNKNSGIPFICWIPDFQSFHLPEMFSESFCKREKRLNTMMVKKSSLVVLSSEDAKRDFVNIFSEKFVSKVRVLHFVPVIEGDSYLKENVLDNYNLYAYKYFLVSNQFWNHKNHMIVLNAVRNLLNQGKNVDFKIVMTGRQPEDKESGVFGEILNYIQNNNLGEKVILTGDISYEDLKSLRYFSMAVIQPSLFEGWNTSVEECKLFGKKVILSNIGVHKEQNPDNAIYFEPTDSTRLADILYDVAINYDIEREKEAEQKANEKREESLKTFADSFMNIINEALRNY